MAVKTNFSRHQIDILAAPYGIGKVLRIEPIGSGRVETNYFIETESTRAVFRYYENRSLESALFEADLLKWLQSKDYPCPMQFVSADGPVHLHEGKPYALFEFMHGNHIEHPSPEQYEELARQVAHLNNVCCGFSSPYSPARLNYTPDGCAEQARKIAATLGTKEASAKLDWYLSCLADLDLPQEHPMLPCHTDFHFSNVLFDNGSFSALLDFDDANMTYSTFDLIKLMEPFRTDFEWNTWQNFDREADIFDFTHSAAIGAAYQSVRPLSPIEKEHLLDVYKLYVLTDVLWYFHRGDLSDFYERRKIEAIDRLGRAEFTRRCLNG